MSVCALVKLDAVEWLKTIESESVDLIITDPPYESLEKHRAKGTTTRLKVSKGSSNVWFDIFPNERFPELLTEVFRVLKKNSHFYLFCDQETMFVVKPMAEDVGFKFWKPLVWDKQKIGMGYHYRARYELILFFEKGKRKLKNLGIPDVLCEDRIRGGYPTEKPVNLSKILIEQSSDEGDLVIDPFFGSGSVGAACSMSSRNFQGADISDYAHELASERLTLNVKAETEMENNTKADILNIEGSEKKATKQFKMEFA
jgi:site-specific DNA-methyltransferase (adenine-specific)